MFLNENLLIRIVLSFTLVLFFSCRSVTHKSSADEIIDVSSRKIHSFLVDNSKFLENKKILILPLTIDKGNQKEKIPLFGIYIAKSVSGLVGKGENFLVADYFLYSRKDGNEKDWDFLLMGEILIRDVTIEIIAKIVNRDRYVFRSRSFLMPLNQSVWKYLNDCGDVKCFEDKDIFD